MATKKPKAPQTKAVPKNTPAPKGPENADVSATGAAQAAPQASTSSDASGSSETTENSPQGGATVTATLPAADGAGAEAASGSPETAATTSAAADAPVTVDFVAGGADKADLVVDRMMIVAKVEGFRRAGRAWSRQHAETVSPDDFSEEQLKALLSEPMLEVTIFAK